MNPLEHQLRSSFDASSIGELHNLLLMQEPDNNSEYGERSNVGAVANVSTEGTSNEKSKLKLQRPRLSW